VTAVSVRPTESADRLPVLDVVRSAFADGEDGSGGQVEVDLVSWVWSSDAHLPDLDLVAVDASGEVVGHVLHSRAEVVGAPDASVAALAPLAVVPGWQRRGVGSGLVTEALRRADTAGASLVVLLGHPAYYPRFGFEPAQGLGLEPPRELRDEAAFMARRSPAFVPGSCAGRFRFAWGGRW